MTFEAACMTPEERAVWLEMAERVRNGGRRPCVDCPLAFAAEMRAVGRCNGEPWHAAQSEPFDAKAYKREWQARWRARRREAEGRRRYERRPVDTNRHNPLPAHGNAPDNRSVKQPNTGGASVILHVAATP